ncbi:MAG: NTP transferase domain-containing protein, partial [Chloroflexota bacterium]
MSTVGDGATAVVILAGGLGTRMQDLGQAGMHPLAGRPIVDHVLGVAAGLSPLPPVLVVSPATEQVAEHADGRALRALQAEPRGTADALAAALPRIPAGATAVVVLSGDERGGGARHVAAQDDHGRGAGGEPGEGRGAGRGRAARLRRGGALRA